MLYDLDKTQEWLQRTQQLHSAVRAKHAPSRSRLSDILLVAALLLACVAIWMMVRGWWSVAGAARASSPHAEPTTAASPRKAPEWQPPPTAPPIRSTWTEPRLVDAVAEPRGEEVGGAPPPRVLPSFFPKPGHAAPPAPVWLDGEGR